MKTQHQDGRFFLFEQPVGSELYLEKALEEIYDLPPNQESSAVVKSCIGHGCMYGFIHPSLKLPIFKKFRWLANHTRLLQAVGKRCDSSHNHVPISGKKNTVASGIYTEQLARNILEAIQDIAAQREPSRFASFDSVPSDVFFVDANKEIADWDRVVVLTEELLDRSSTKAPMTQDVDSSIYKVVCAVVPWEITRVQVVPAPKARRMPTDVMWLHRGALLVPIDGDPVVETEALADLVFPRVRFRQQIRYAVMFWGVAPEDPQPDTPQPPEEPPQPVETNLPEDGGLGVDDDDLPPTSRTTVPQPSQHGDIKFYGLTKDQAPLSLRRTCARLHINFGHPPKKELIRFAASQGASSSTLLVLSALYCAACMRAEKISQPRPSKMPRVGQFGDQVQLDFFFPTDLTGCTHLLLGMLDVATLLHMVRRCMSRNAEHVWRVFADAWLTPFGLPRDIVCDMDGVFRGFFEETSRILGVNIRFAAPGAHWQIGKVESHDDVFCTMLERMIDDMAIVNGEQLDVAITACCHAKNSRVKQGGRTAFMAAFGRVPTLPAELLSDEASSSAAVFANMSQRQALAFSEEARVSALRVAADLEGNQLIRTAVLRKATHMREFDPEPGQTVCIWREQSGRKRQSKTSSAGYRPATFCLWDPGTEGRGQKAMAWVRCGSRTLAVAREQIRPAYGYEHWTPDRQAWQELRAAQVDLARHAESPAEPVISEAPAQEVGPDEWRNIPEPSIEAASAAAPSALNTSTSSSQPSSVGKLNSSVNKSSSSSSSSSSALKQGPLSEKSEKVSPAVLAYEPESPRLSSGSEQGDHDDPQPPSPKRARHEGSSSLSDVQWISDEVFTFEASTGDFSEVLPGGFVKDCSSLFDEVPVDPMEEAFLTENLDDLSDEDRLDITGQTPELTRQQRKALDREIPWREILERNPEDVQAFVAALRKEADNWDKWQSVEGLEHDEAQAILSQPNLRRRCMPSRICYRDKACGIGPLQAKARPVILGFKDPDLKSMRRNASVMRRTTLFVILQIAATNYFSEDGPWLVGAGDALSAFLQGQQVDREEPLYMLPPRDPLVKAAGVFLHELYIIRGNVYGGANGPYLWRCHVRKVLIGTCGFVSLRCDEMVFVYREQDKVLCVIGFHVDDAIMVCSPRFRIQIILRAFSWSPWRWLDDGQVDMVGLELNRITHGENKGGIAVTQTKYVLETPVRKLPAVKGIPADAPLDREGKQEFSSCSGCLGWTTGKTRADLAAAVSLLHQQPTRSGLRQLYSVLEYAHKTADVGILIVPVPFSEAVLVAFHDSSWANAANLRTQVGYAVLFVSSYCLQRPCAASMLEHRSVRTPRVVKSSLAGEACAATTAADSMYFVGAIISEILYGTDVGRVRPQIDMYCVTDCKSLYDAVHQSTPSLTEKRTILDVVSIQELIPPTRFRWVPTTQMVADGLTKFDWKLMANLTSFMRDPKVCLVDLETPKASGKT